ncbi:alpha-1,2-fucosyltransferase [soil metagenome]
MIIVKLMGGLGNQMFQYAFGRRLAYVHNTQLKLDLSEYFKQPENMPGYVCRDYDLDIFTLDAEFAREYEVLRLGRRSRTDRAERWLNKLLGPKKGRVIEPHFQFAKSAYNSPDNVHLVGYWQSEKYFADIEPELRSDFRFRQELSPASANLLERIANSNSICVNVRRGDFVTNDFLGSFGSDYFHMAETVIENRVADPVYFVFSDEIDWCKKNLKFRAQTVFVSHEYAGRKFQDYLRLMSGCKHFIIPNSSFAWWAVWFNQDPDKIVIAPNKWFNDSSVNTEDLIPDDWLRI